MAIHIDHVEGDISEIPGEMNIFFYLSLTLVLVTYS